MNPTNQLRIAFINIKGQTGLHIAKQIQIEDFVKQNKIDIVNLQEINIENDTFSECKYITSSFNLLVNNSQNKYGTACLVRNEYQVENINMDKEGRIIIFEMGGMTCGNVYIQSGTDALARGKRENCFSEVIPQLLINHRQQGYVGGDFNSIIQKEDATHNPESKLSPSLKRLVSVFKWKDSFRTLYPQAREFSRYYNHDRTGFGGSRIDRCYHWGAITIVETKYSSLAFSDHLAMIVTLSMPDQMAKMTSPKSRPFFRTSPEVVVDNIFRKNLSNSMTVWLDIKNQGVDVLLWWEKLVKPGIKKLALERGKELKKERRSHLNLLLVKQAYLTMKIQRGKLSRLTELKVVQHQVEEWYDRECKKIAIQLKTDDIQQSEKIRIFHHEIHQMVIKKSAILKLDTEYGMLEGHKACAKYLEDSVAELLLHPGLLDPRAQEALLKEVDPVFTEADNEMLCRIPNKEEVKQVLWDSNQHAAPGTDGLTAYLYRQCWDVLGNPLTEVVQAVFEGGKPTQSQKTSLMVFGSKPSKQQSLKPKDKRKISLLNVDFKIMTGLEAKRHRKVMTHTVSHLQLVAGADRRVHHGIALARDAIHAAGKSRAGCGILDTDLVAAFDWMVMDWVKMVLAKKGMCEEAISRISNLYSESISIIVVNNVLGRSIKNIRHSIRQGDKASMEWFTYGIDPILTYLENRLQGILIHSLPLQGPTLAGQPSLLPGLDLKYKLIAYCDDVKPAITSMSEFLLVDKAMSLFEKSSGCRLHRDPTEGKCKFLALGRWKGTLSQEDLPCNFFRLSDQLDMLGVTLKATYMATRKANGEVLQEKIKKVVGPWRAGKYMPLIMRPYSLNSYALPKLWHRCNTINLRIGDINNINKLVKSWLYADLLEKPEELALYRHPADGGLGLHHIQCRALAFQINCFLETACKPDFARNQYHQALLQTHVYEEDPTGPEIPPYFGGDFFPAIKRLYASPLSLSRLTLKQIYRFLFEEITETEELNQTRTMKPLRIELRNPLNQWDKIWLNSRQHMLGPDICSFLFKLLHQILPTAERVNRILPNQSQLCTKCQLHEIETLQHALMDCPSNQGVSTTLCNGLKKYQPSLTKQDILAINFQTEENLLFPLVWTTASFLSSLWQLRVEKKRVELIKIRADLEASVRLLRESRLTSTIEMLSKIF